MRRRREIVIIINPRARARDSVSLRSEGSERGGAEADANGEAIISGIDPVTKHAYDDAAVADVPLAPLVAVMPCRRVRRRGHLHAHAAEEHTGTELSSELIDLT